MFMIVMIVTILAVTVYKNARREYETMTETVTFKCPPHKWYYDTDGWMKCSQCKIDTRTSLTNETDR